MQEIKVSLRRSRRGVLPGYPPEFNEEFKRYIRKRDKHRCAICNKRKRLDVHHVDYIKQNTTKLNCVSLCRYCHFLLHRLSWSERMVWKYKLWDLVAKREAGKWKEMSEKL